jgi:hypothetical protein
LGIKDTMNNKLLEVGNELFVVKRRFKIEQWEKVVKHFGAKTICENYHCETILRGRDGYFYLCDKVDDAKIIN